MEITVKNLSKNFGNVKALDNVGFQISEGKALGLLGRNGAGKTTTIRILLDIIDGDSGEILVDGNKIDRNKISFGYLPEERGLYLKYTVKDQLLYFASLYGMKKRDALNSITYWLNRFDAMEYLNKKVDTLSKGNKQKIQLIVAIMHNPQIVILDEPFSGLDPVNVEIFKEIIRELLSKHKILIFSSHRMSDVEEFCDDIIMLKQGQTILQGNLEKIKEEYGVKGLVIKGEEGIKEILLKKSINDFAFSGKEFNIPISDIEKGEQILKSIILKGLRVYEFYFLKPSLNDIFLERLGE